MQIKWLKKALHNLDSEASYIATENPAAARDFVAQLKKQISALSQQPSLGRPGRVSGTRELVINGYPYLVPYRVKNEVVEILRVFHTRRRLPQNW
ncbi:type II toxin-antitoxin system RelE/ParE family toxin [Neisseriaceae bacterium TC5R-5]|nr:type II toxin-antitoxin system RelE/ParE family toxin [Neisseriaceae bacterium TC5R-5]